MGNTRNNQLKSNGYKLKKIGDNMKKSNKTTLLKPKRMKKRVLRAMENKAPKLVENVKKLLLVRGNKTNTVMNQVLTDMVLFLYIYM